MADKSEFKLHLLTAVRLPARLNAEEVALLLGFSPHDIPILVKAKLLKPLGKGSKNSVKYFAADDIAKLADNKRWLADASDAVRERKSSKADSKAKGPRPKSVTSGDEPCPD